MKRRKFFANYDNGTLKRGSRPSKSNYKRKLSRTPVNSQNFPTKSSFSAARSSILLTESSFSPAKLSNSAHKKRFKCKYYLKTFAHIIKLFASLLNYLNVKFALKPFAIMANR